MNRTTADLCDTYGDALRVLDPLFRCYGARRKFEGPVTTLKLFEDNALVRSTLSQKGGGRVLVIDGGGSLRRALVGDQLAKLAVTNGWAGLVVYGCIRDSAAIAEFGIGLRAIGTTPARGEKLGTGHRDVPVTFAGVTIRPGDYLVADEDGVVVLDTRPDGDADQEAEYVR